MGSGKSTVGPLLAREMERSFYDLDELIEKEQKMTISEIFESRGEAYFRDVESHLLQQTAHGSPAVIALGGGTFIRQANRELVERTGISVWLQIPLRLAEERCREVTNRPLARDPEQFQALFYRRQPYYQAAQVHVNVEGKTPAQICREIQDRLVGKLV